MKIYGVLFVLSLTLTRLEARHDKPNIKESQPAAAGEKSVAATVPEVRVDAEAAVVTDDYVLYDDAEDSGPQSASEGNFLPDLKKENSIELENYSDEEGSEGSLNSSNESSEEKHGLQKKGDKGNKKIYAINDKKKDRKMTENKNSHDTKVPQSPVQKMSEKLTKDMKADLKNKHDKGKKVFSAEWESKNGKGEAETSGAKGARQNSDSKAFKETSKVNMPEPSKKAGEAEPKNIRHNKIIKVLKGNSEEPKRQNPETHDKDGTTFENGKHLLQNEQEDLDMDTKICSDLEEVEHSHPRSPKLNSKQKCPESQASSTKNVMETNETQGQKSKVVHPLHHIAKQIPELAKENNHPKAHSNATHSNLKKQKYIDKPIQPQIIPSDSKDHSKPSQSQNILRDQVENPKPVQPQNVLKVTQHNPKEHHSRPLIKPSSETETNGPVVSPDANIEELHKEMPQNSKQQEAKTEPKPELQLPDARTSHKLNQSFDAHKIQQNHEKGIHHPPNNPTELEPKSKSASNQQITQQEPASEKNSQIANQNPSELDNTATKAKNIQKLTLNQSLNSKEEKSDPTTLRKMAHELGAVHPPLEKEEILSAQEDNESNKAGKSSKLIREMAHRSNKALIAVSLTLIVSTIVFTIIGVYFGKISIGRRHNVGHRLFPTSEDDVPLFNREEYHDENTGYESWRSMRQ